MTAFASRFLAGNFFTKKDSSSSKALLLNFLGDVLDKFDAVLFEKTWDDWAEAAAKAEAKEGPAILFELCGCIADGGGDTTLTDVSSLDEDTGKVVDIWAEGLLVLKGIIGDLTPDTWFKGKDELAFAIDGTSIDFFRGTKN